MIHLICKTCSNHFFSRETNKEYKCPFCDVELQPTERKRNQTATKVSQPLSQEARL